MSILATRPAVGCFGCKREGHKPLAICTRKPNVIEFAFIYPYKPLEFSWLPTPSTVENHSVHSTRRSPCMLRPTVRNGQVRGTSWGSKIAREVPYARFFCATVIRGIPARRGACDSGYAPLTALPDSARRSAVCLVQCRIAFSAHTRATRWSGSTMFGHILSAWRLLTDGVAYSVLVPYISIGQTLLRGIHGCGSGDL